MGPLNLKNMKRTINFLKSAISVSIVMLGAYLVSFYINNNISFTSVFFGIMGLLILFPAITGWDKTIWGNRKSNANRN